MIKKDKRKLKEQCLAKELAGAKKEYEDGMHYVGIVVPEDYADAWKYYQENNTKKWWVNNDYLSSSNCGYYAMGDMYLHGWGGEKDLGKAEEYFKKIIDSNNRQQTKDVYYELAMLQIARLTINKYLDLPEEIVHECKVCDYELACKYVDEVADKYSDEDVNNTFWQFITKDELQELVRKADFIRFADNVIYRELIHPPVTHNNSGSVTFIVG